MFNLAKWHWPLLIVLITLLFACSSGQISAAEAGDPAARAAAPVQSGLDGLIPPRTAAAMLSAPPVTTATGAGLLLFGANGVEQYGGARVATDLHLATFSPADPPTARPGSEPAYALYCFNLNEYTGAGELRFTWEGDAPPPGQAYIGLGNQATGAWDWVQPESFTAALEIAELPTYKSGNGRLVIAVVVIGNGEYTLESVLLGERWLVEDADFTELFAPPLECEIDRQWELWAERDPTEHFYDYVGDVTDGDGVKRAVIRHQVDGYNHYATFRYPVATGAESYPLIVFCHPGSGLGCYLEAERDFCYLCPDTDFTDQFFVAMPSFRSEGCTGGELGNFTSNGPASVNDRDADDTIALIDCLLSHFPEIDADNIYVYGFSRGCQVALRVAQRDERVNGVIGYAGYNDEWALDMQLWSANAYPQVTATEPGNHFAHLLWDLKYGTQDVFAARQSLLVTTIAYFCDALPPTQLHYGLNDTAVSIIQGRRLETVLAERGHDYEYYEYDAGHSEFIGMGGGTRLQAFLERLMAE